MGTKFHGAFGHHSAGACHVYETTEQLAFGFGDKAELRVRGKLVSYLDHQAVVRLGNGQSPAGHQLRRPHPRLKQGEGLSMTVPWTVTAAMKERGLLNDPQTAFSCLNSAAAGALRELNRHAYGRTTEYRKVTVGGHSVVRRFTKRVKVDLYPLLYRGFRTRAGQVAPQFTVYVPNMGRAADGKHYALDWKGLYNAQQDIQSVWHLGLAYELGRKAGITCVPHKHSMRALGIDQRAPPKRTKQIRKKLRGKRARGPRARDWAARESRAPKPKVSWADAVSNTIYRLAGAVKRQVVQLNKSRQRRFAQRCVRTAVKQCSDNSLQFRTRDVKAAAAHMALPHVRPAVFVRAFRHEMARIEALGVTKVRELGGGEALFTSVKQVTAERHAVEALTVGTARKSGRLSPQQVTGALAARGHDARELARVQKLVGSGGVTIDATGLTDRPETLKAVIDAYKGNKRPVYLINRSRRAGAYTPKEFVSASTRTSHLVALWRGLRTRGSLMDKLAVAEHIRRASKGGPKRGALVVADVRVTDAVELRRIIELVLRAKGHLVLVGEGAKQLAPLVEQQRQNQMRGPKR